MGPEFEPQMGRDFFSSSFSSIFFFFVFFYYGFSEKNDFESIFIIFGLIPERIYINATIRSDEVDIAGKLNFLFTVKYVYTVSERCSG